MLAERHRLLARSLCLASLCTALAGCAAAQATSSGGKASAPAAEAPLDREEEPADGSLDDRTSDADGGAQPSAPSSLSFMSEQEEAASLETLDGATRVLELAVAHLDALADQAPGSGAARLATGTSGCSDACRAFASLRRAADAICRLAGDESSRCQQARNTVADNARRINECGCQTDR